MNKVRVEWDDEKEERKEEEREYKEQEMFESICSRGKREEKKVKMKRNESPSSSSFLPTHSIWNWTKCLCWYSLQNQCFKKTISIIFIIFISLCLISCNTFTLLSLSPHLASFILKLTVQFFQWFFSRMDCSSLSIRLTWVTNHSSIEWE